MLFKTRYSLLPAIISLYSIPLIVFGLYITNRIPGLTWKAFCCGLLLLALGTSGFFFLLRYWESLNSKDYFDEEPPGTNSSRITEEMYERLQQQLQDEQSRSRQEEAERLASTRIYEQLQIELQAESQALSNALNERDQLRVKLDTLTEELTKVKESSQEKLEQNQIFLNEHQQTINEQRHVIEIKQQHTQQLEDKVRDLTYEIKTLLNLAEKTQLNDLSSYPMRQEAIPRVNLGDSTIHPSNNATQSSDGESEASHQLRRCLDIAQKMTGASHYNKQSKKSELSVEHHALDLRCLFESLRNESSFSLLVYSQKENKLIFGNNRIKSLLGWSSEKFIQSFPAIIEESVETWNNCLAQLAYKNECQAELSMKTKGGTSMSVKCHLGIIPTGIFRSNIIGVLSET